MNKYIAIILTFFIGLELSGQGIQDALRISYTKPGGSARTIGAGGAFGALGGDFGSLAINPAGLAVYRSSEFVISPGMMNIESESILSGSNTINSSSKKHLSLENIGIIMNRNPIGSSWTTSNFAIGFNKIANFNRDFAFSGSSIGSITERWVQQADGLSSGDIDPYEAQPAFIAGAIYDFDENTLYNTDLDAFPDQQIRKNQTIQERGGINELSLGWGGSYDNKMNIGVSIGIPFVSFRQTKTYVEEDPNDEIPVFNELEFTEFLNTTGAGFNFKAGVIYTPSRQLRVGVALHSPTWYVLTEDFLNEITYDFSDGNGNQRFTEASPDGNFRYRFSAPWKAILSIGSLYSVGDLKGFVSADIEYRDYSANRFDLSSHSNNSADAEYSRDLNNDINNLLTSTTIIRLGTELAYQKYRVRAGANLEQSPFANDERSFDKGYSFGLGLREDKFFLDVAYSVASTSEGYYAYITNDESRDPFVSSDITSGNIVATLGFKF